MPNKPSPKGNLIVLALILIALIPFAIHRSPGPTTKPETKVNPVSSRGSTNSTDQSRKGSRAKNRSQKPPSHRPEDLKNFYLTPRTFRNVSLEEAIGLLLEDYYAICEASGESPIRIAWSIEGNTKIIPYLKSQKDFHTTCRLLALLSGTSFEFKENQINFSELSGEKITTRFFTLPKTFNAYLNSAFTDHGDDPFADGIPASELLPQIGLINEGGELNYFWAESRIKVTGNEKTQWLINELAEIMVQDIPLLTRIRFSDLTQKDSSPSVILQPGTLAKIPTTILESGRNESYQKPVTLIVSPHGLGEKIELFYNLDEDPFGGFLISSNRPDQTYLSGPGDLSEDRTIEIQIPNSSGGTQQRTLTLQRIDATGRPISTTASSPE